MAILLMHSILIIHKVRKNALGYLVSNHLIRRALYKEVITKPNIKIISGTYVVNVSTGEHSAFVKLK